MSCHDLVEKFLASENIALHTIHVVAIGGGWEAGIGGCNLGAGMANTTVPGIINVNLTLVPACKCQDQTPQNRLIRTSLLYIH
jgi:hypothetical protein